MLVVSQGLRVAVGVVGPESRALPAGIREAGAAAGDDQGPAGRYPGVHGLEVSGVPEQSGVGCLGAKHTDLAIDVVGNHLQNRVDTAHSDPIELRDWNVCHGVDDLQASDSHGRSLAPAHPRSLSGVPRWIWRGGHAWSREMDEQTLPRGQAPPAQTRSSEMTSGSDQIARERDHIG